MNVPFFHSNLDVGSLYWLLTYALSIENQIINPREHSPSCLPGCLGVKAEGIEYARDRLCQFIAEFIGPLIRTGIC
jgi:hypothetical protein